MPANVPLGNVVRGSTLVTIVGAVLPVVDGSDRAIVELDVPFPVSFIDVTVVRWAKQAHEELKVGLHIPL
jgi:hypothetical protein